MFCPKGGKKEENCDSQIKFVYIVVHYLDHVHSLSHCKLLGQRPGKKLFPCQGWTRL